MRPNTSTTRIIPSCVRFHQQTGRGATFTRSREALGNPQPHRSKSYPAQVRRHLSIRDDLHDAGLCLSCAERFSERAYESAWLARLSLLLLVIAPYGEDPFADARSADINDINEEG